MRSSNAAVVLQTLVPQAREIFKLLAQAQLSEQADEDGSEGPLTSLAMPHKDIDFGLASLPWEASFQPVVFGQQPELLNRASA